MASTIDVLFKIQKVDHEISKVEKEGSVLRDEIGKMTEEVRLLEGLVEVAASQFDEVDTIFKGIKEDIRINNDKISKGEEKLNDVTSDKAYKALTKEITTAKRNLKAAGERIEKLQPSLDEKSSALQEKKTEIEAKTTEIEALKAEVESKESAWQALIGEKQVEREAVVKDINPSLLKRYETIKSRRGGRGLAQILDETCQECFMHIPPQVYIIMMKGTEELIPCPNCHRILYFLREDSPQSPVTLAE